MENVVFVYGAYHGTWCWEEKFLKKFMDKGYKTYCADLRNSLKQKKENVLNTYVDKLYEKIKQLSGEAMLVAHSAYSIVVLEYLKKYPDSVKAVVFLAPLPIRFEFPRILCSGIRQMLYGQRKVFFSDRLPDKKTEEYLNKMTKQEPGLTLETSRKHWDKNKKLPVPALFAGSANDHCIKGKWVKETAQLLNADYVIYKDLCHDMMLDPEAMKAADDILQFFEKVKRKDTDKYAETRSIC